MKSDKNNSSIIRDHNLLDLSVVALPTTNSANYIVTTHEIYDQVIFQNSKKYDRTKIAKEMDPILRLMKKIGYEV